MKPTLKATAAILGAAAVVLSIAFGLNGVVILPALLLCSFGGASIIKQNSK